MLGQTEVASHDALSSGGAQQYHNFWLYDPDLGVQPGTARIDFNRVGLFVDAPFASRLPFPGRSRHTDDRRRRVAPTGEELRPGSSPKLHSVFAFALLCSWLKT